MTKKILKSIVSIWFVFGVLTACNKNSEINPTQPGVIPPPTRNVDEESTDGGISAGGGGTLPADPIPIYKVLEIIDLAKMQLRLFANHESRLLRGSPQNKPWSWFHGANNISTILESTDIEILEDRPCKDRLGRNADASIYASRPNTICISAFRIAPKLVEETANKEILALIVHEFSHLLGANEAEAIELQKFVARRLQGVQLDDAKEIRYGQESILDEVHKFAILNAKYESLQDYVRKDDKNSIRSFFRDVLTAIEAVRSRFGYDANFSLLNGKQSDYLDVLQTKIWINDAFVLSQIEDSNHQDTIKKRYEECFPETDYATASELSKNNDCPNMIDDSTEIGNFRFNKLLKLEDLESELKDSFLILQDISAALRALAFDGSPTYFHTVEELLNPTLEINPWHKFVGKYKAEVVNCRTSDNQPIGPFEELTEIEISVSAFNYPVPNQPAIQLIQKGTNHSSTFYLANGNSSYHTLRLSGTENTAESSEKQGSRWYSRNGYQGWSHTFRSLRKTEAQMIFEIENEQFSHNYKGIWERKSICSYKLAKQ